MAHPSASPAPAANATGLRVAPRDGDRQQRDAPRGHAREVAVGRDRHPDRRRRHRDERRGQPGRRLVGERAHRDDDGGRRTRADEQAQQARPGATAEADAVQPHERQQGARGMPETCVIHEFGWKSRILLLNVRTASGMSVIVGTWRRYSWRAVEPAREATLPAVDHRQRERPPARRRPRHPRHCAPRQALRDGPGPRPPPRRR